MFSLSISGWCGPHADDKQVLESFANNIPATGSLRLARVLESLQLTYSSSCKCVGLIYPGPLCVECSKALYYRGCMLELCYVESMVVRSHLV
jgi:hypothetical protein